MKELLLGIDIGTSACKVAVFTPDGEVMAQKSESYPVYHPQPGWAEQDPQDWWKAVGKALRNMFLESGLSPASIAAIGVDGQSWSAIPVDSEGNVLANTPIWMDYRAEEQCAEILKKVSAEKLFAISGNPLQAAYSFPKMLWFKENIPNVYDKTYKFLQANSFLVQRLTGEFTQDLSQGYGLCCFNMETGQWDTVLCWELGVDPKLLPDLFPSHQVVGKVTAQAAAFTGLLEGIPVVAGGLDAACGTLGAGVVRPGESQEQGGQAGGMSICMDSCKASPKLILSRHVAPDRWLLQGGTVGGGGILRWLEEQICNEELRASRKNLTSVYYEMDKMAENIQSGSDGLIMLPYMAGERSPIWNSKAKGVYFGLDYSKTRAHMIRSAMEAVAFSLRHNLDTASAAGVEVGELRAMGGAANSRLWTQIKADVTGREIAVPASDTATTLGAAILAGVGVGIYPDVETAVERTVAVKRRYSPNPANREVYDKGYQTYLALYENLKNLMNEA
ncbi:MAG: xylulokinase [Oscillospiraceae bacterium]